MKETFGKLMNNPLFGFTFGVVFTLLFTLVAQYESHPILIGGCLGLLSSAIKEGVNIGLGNKFNVSNTVFTVLGVVAVVLAYVL